MNDAARQTTRERVAFSSATRLHVAGVLGLNLERLERGESSLVLPDDVGVSVISETLQNKLHYHVRHWDLSREASRILLISDFLYEATSQFKSSLKISQEVPLNYKQGGIRFSGAMDLAISGEGLMSRLLVVEAKRGWTLGEGLYQLLCEAGCLLRSREKIDKNTPILAVLTDGFHFQFFAIDERDGSVHRSKVVFVDLTNISDFRCDPQVIEVVRWLVWFLQIFVAVSPTSSTQEWSSVNHISKLQQLRRCFTP